MNLFILALSFTAWANPVWDPQESLSPELSQTLKQWILEHETAVGEKIRLAFLSEAPLDGSPFSPERPFLESWEGRADVVPRNTVALVFSKKNAQAFFSIDMETTLDPEKLNTYEKTLRQLAEELPPNELVPATVVQTLQLLKSPIIARVRSAKTPIALQAFSKKTQPRVQVQQWVGNGLILFLSLALMVLGPMAIVSLVFPLICIQSSAISKYFTRPFKNSTPSPPYAIFQGHWNREVP